MKTIIATFIFISIVWILPAQDNDTSYVGFRDYPKTVYLYGGVGLGSNPRFTKLKDYSNQSMPFVVGVEGSGISIKGFKMPNIISNGAYFGYNSYGFVNTDMGNFRYKSYTLATRTTVQVLPLLMGTIIKKKMKYPIGVYVGAQAGYEYTMLETGNAYYDYLLGYYGVGSRFFAQPFVGGEIYLGPLGVYAELGKTTKSFVSAGLRVRFQKK